MTLGQVRLYLDADDRRRRGDLKTRFLAARAAWMEGADFKKLIDSLDA